MMIGGVSGGMSPHASKPAENGSGSVAQLEQQKKVLQDQIKRVKEDDALTPEAKKKQLSILQKKLEKIDKAIQKASENPKVDPESKTSAIESEEKKASEADDLQKLLQESDSSKEEKARKKRFGEDGNLLDVYV